MARNTLEAHRADPRQHREAQLASANTHDRYWDAAILEMSGHGLHAQSHAHVWGNKILEWSASPEKAFKTALSLNNRYFLCGRDPNSYANVAWCFGLHDRPWPERAIFGRVRSMIADGLKRKIDVDAYVNRVEDLVEAEAG